MILDIRLRSGDGDSGICTTFGGPMSPYGEAAALARTFPFDVLILPEGAAIQEYYGVTQTDNFGKGVGPSWGQIAAIIDWIEGEV
jgi:hypothetical protein